MVLSKMTIKQQWESLREKALPDSGGFSKEQIHESKKMFYSGFAYMFHIMDELGDVPESIAVDVLSSLNKELNDFCEELKKAVT